MADYALTYSGAFDASHVEAAVPGCSRMHGHTYRVMATVEGRLEPDEYNVPRVARYAEVELVDLCMELDGRDLNQMLPGVSTTPEGIAAWFLERLPAATEIEVTQGWRELTGRARRTRR
jgi:6-pyruvoyl-tetrahydropterin synthase